MILALKGATVTGIDVAPRAIEVARKRAQMHNVADRVEFHALPVESYLLQVGGKFDIICGFAVLHHLIPVLDQITADLKKLAHEDTCFMFTEPVALSHALRRLRLALPLKIHGTPDERPLEPQDLAVLSRHLPNIRSQLFGFLLRPWHRFLRGRYEDLAPLPRTLYDALARLDIAILSLPSFRALASTGVICAGQARR